MMIYTPKIPKNLGLVTDATVAPFHQHDCNCCHFLGRYRSDRGLADLYVHGTGSDPTVISRFGSDGPEYSSGACFSYGQIEALTEARVRAQALGLWDYNVQEALFCTDKEHPASYAELMAALPFTPEYQAALAFEAGNSDRYQGLVRHLLEKVHTRALKYKPQTVLGASLIEAQSRIERVVSAYRGCGTMETMKKIEGIGEFIWQTLQTSPAQLFKESLAC